MIKHPLIRQAVLDVLKQSITDEPVTWYDGRPAFIEADDLPVVAVYISDAAPTGETLDFDEWSATLHIEVFLKAVSPDSMLDSWVEQKIYPAIQDIPALSTLLETMSPQGYDYQRDDEMATWGSADLRYSINYFM
ncbi:phage tail protein [Serratia sp. Leaf50]|uniref:phage tail terminator protein n=1 Tax=Rouxiella sp. S1S-2 TaxID=2653856 RepID=UPI0006F468DF|nr:phage tail terminator protein [Rouxiella sp. S1S-2]KAB7896438.1 phage tail protein [Rouxiella sp. S1S-2]KQN46637.1 phage tail protein [Serratia sp. Leaf50]